MLYFSEIAGQKVFTEDQVYIGKLIDLIFTAAETPTITKLVLCDSQKNIFIIPTKYIHKFEINLPLIIKKNYQIGKLGENELYLVKNLLDKQIIDIQGNKIVRVNDVVIQNKPNLYVVGVDTGLLSIFRWFHCEPIMIRILQLFKLPYHQHMLSWADIQPLELARGRVKLKQADDRLERVRPEDLADHLETTNIVNVRNILNILDENFAAEVINNLNISYQTALFKQFSPERAAKVISLLDPDEAVDIILTLEPQQQNEIISLLEPEVKSEIGYLINLSKTPIGELITSEYLTVDSSMTVRNIIDTIKKEALEFSQLNYLYVVNKKNQLVGVCNLQELLMEKLDTPVFKFMTQNVVVIHLSTPEEIAIKKMLKYKLYALPVINNDKQLLGIVTLDDIAEFILEHIQ